MMKRIKRRYYFNGSLLEFRVLGYYDRESKL